MKISILIPTMGSNFSYLKCLLDSIRKNTFTDDYEVLVHVNESTQEAREFLLENDDVSDYLGDITLVEENWGLPKSLNGLGRFANGDYICYLNDDMYVGPGWDEVLFTKVNPDIRYQYLTAAMFEPRYDNVCMNSPMDYGRTPEDFREEDFLKEWKDKRRITQDIVSPYCPIFVSKKLWDEVGGYDERYFPCYGTDPDFAAAIYFEAKTTGQPCEFRAVADACVYHFQCVTTDNIPNNQRYRDEAKALFIQKWGMDYTTFYNQHLEIGREL